MSAVLAPQSLAEALELLDRHRDAQPLAGGTDLLVRRRAAAATSADDSPPLLWLARIDALRRIAEDADGALAIGAATSFAQLIADPLAGHRAPLLLRAARTIGGPALRNMATIGGNVATASPAGDSLAALHLLGAEIELASRRATRRLPIAEFIGGPGKTARHADELITRIVVPPAPPLPCQAFEKVGRRRAMAISVVSFCAAARLAADGTIAEARLAWGSVAPTVLRLPALESALAGARADRATIADAVRLVEDGVRPIDDLRASAAYRRRVAGRLLARFLGGLGGESGANFAADCGADRDG